MRRLAMSILAGAIAAAPVVVGAPVGAQHTERLASAEPDRRVFIASDSLLASLQRRLASGRPGQPVRIAHLGDSHSEQGGLASELAARWSGSAPVSPAFVTPYSAGVGLVRIRLSRGWQRSTWLRDVPRTIEGPSGSAAVTARATATMRVELPPDLPAGTRVTIWWSGPPGASFRVQMGTTARWVHRVTPVRPDAPLEQTMIPLPPGTREVVLDRIRVPRQTPLRIGGFSVERPDATIEYDLLGLQSTTPRHPMTQEAGSLRQFLATRQHDVILLWYGTNAVKAVPIGADRFRRDLIALIQLVRRASPQAALILIGPPDLAELDPSARRPARPSRRSRRTRSRPPPPIPCPSTEERAPAVAPAGAVARRSHPNVRALRDAIREVAQAQGAAFFDPYALQGEEGGMVRWYCETPRLAGIDLIHLTDAGYRRLATSLDAALWARRLP